MRGLIKYLDVLPVLDNRQRVITNISSNGSSWQVFIGNEILNLKEDLLEKLYVQKVETQMSYEKDGVYPVLVIYASNDVKLIEFKLPDNIQNNHDSDKESEE